MITIGKTIGEIKRRWPAGIVAQQLPEFLLKLLTFNNFQVTVLQLVNILVHHFGNEGSPECAVISFIV